MEQATRYSRLGASRIDMVYGNVDFQSSDGDYLCFSLSVFAGGWDDWKGNEG